MRKTFKQLTAILICFTLLMSCSSNTTKQQTTDASISTTTNKQLVGNDRDEHGCIGSAGYQWSELLHDCIRPFEKGTRLNSSKENQTSAAYLIFNNDSSQVELFLPKMKSHPILDRQTTLDGETIWTGIDEEEWSVRCIEHIWGIYFNHNVRFIKYLEDK